MNNQNNPQEVPQVKSVEELYKLMDEECPFVIHPSVKPYIIEAMEVYAKPLSDRIAELEKQNAVYREALEKVSDVLNYSDGDAEQDDKLSMAYNAMTSIVSLIKLDLNQKTDCERYKDALMRISRLAEGENGLIDHKKTIRRVCEQALNHKSDG